MLLLALWARLGRCPHLTVTLLARLARMLQGALLTQMLRLKFWNMLTRLASMLPLGRCPHLTVTLLAQLARMLQGALLAQMIFFKVLEPLEHSVLDHADPAGQHADVQDTLEPLEHLVLDTVLDGRPMEATTYPEPLEHSVLVETLDGGLMEGMSSLEPLEQSVLNTVCWSHDLWTELWIRTLVRAFGSGDALGLWTFEIGITGVSSGGRCPG